MYFFYDVQFLDVEKYVQACNEIDDESTSS
jgi:hypothetical protein